MQQEALSPLNLLWVASDQNEMLASQVSDAQMNAVKLSTAIDGFRAARPNEEICRLRLVFQKAVDSALEYEKECASLRKQLSAEKEARRSEVEELTRHLKFVSSQSDIKEKRFIVSLEQQLASERSARSAATYESEQNLAMIQEELQHLRRHSNPGLKRTLQLYNTQIQSLLSSALD